ncbi:hypothetical protein MAR_005470 [Mya arenaria]|uniref:Uncharacterized protein n=1 Tax=Mya arenaria TaxID=6604 RepID=A0ABY7EZM2_MYAAR|nr:hypothetical protein MAR_005470 [Mya arenaria]
MLVGNGWESKADSLKKHRDSGIGHEEDADQSDDEDSDDEEDNPSGMAAAKRPNTYIQINDNDIVSIAGDCTMLEGKLAEEPPYVNTSDHADEPTTPRDKPRSTVVTPLAKPVTTRDQPRSAVPLTHAEPVTTRDQPRSAVPLTHAEPVTTRDQPRSAVPLTHAEPVTRRRKGGRPKTEVKMDDNTKNPINTKSSATSEPNSENAMSSVSSRGNNNSKAVKNKGASRSKQMQVNVLEQSIKPSTALGKGPARSYSSPKLQENLYENLRESDQMETDTTK